MGGSGGPLLVRRPHAMHKKTFPNPWMIELRALLTPTQIGYLVSEIRLWHKSSGPEWTCERLKAVHTAALQVRAGDLQLAMTTLRENSIKYYFNGSHISIKGLIGVVFRRFCKAQNHAILRKWHALLRIYTGFTLRKLSRKQYRKAFNAITGPSTANDAFLIECSEKLRRFTSEWSKSSKFPKYKLGNPDFSKLNPFTGSSYPVDVRPIDPGLAYEKHVLSLLSRVWIPPSLEGQNPCEPLRQTLIESGADNETVGHIAFLQEKGCKARVVAVPNVWCQWLFQPLHKYLGRLADSKSSSCLRKQSSGADFMRFHLSNQRELSSVDLSSATDRFPLCIQRAVLEGLGLETWSQAIAEVSKGKWEMRGIDTSFVSYSVGQPMGLYSSFALFHLTHILLLEMIVKKIGAKGDCFVILGDDILISDPNVAERYRKVMELLGVEISVSKTLKSSNVAEFAGFVGHRTPQGIAIYRPYKWRPSSRSKGKKWRPYNVGNVVNRCFSLGKGLRNISNVWRTSYEKVRHSLPFRDYDLTPFVLTDKPKAVNERLTSSFVSARITKQSYTLPYALNEEFHNLWYTQVYSLLNQEEMLVGTGLVIESGPNDGGYCIQEYNPISITPEYEEERFMDEHKALDKDLAVQISQTQLEFSLKPEVEEDLTSYTDFVKSVIASGASLEDFNFMLKSFPEDERGRYAKAYELVMSQDS
uniref:RNA-dependent RNA polymerase n=1 Tax=Halley virus TaxID=2707223 RepID=A0A6H0DI18_9VIRU|nr:MAG: RNA-dependent RNA polymerase [Halley virus]